jgi:hypothetical protein
MIGGRGEQALGPLFAPGTRHCMLPSVSPVGPFPAARGPPLPGGRGSRMRVADAGEDQSGALIDKPRREPQFPARYAAGPGGWGRASPADCRIPSRSGTKGTQHDRAYACGCAMQEAEQFPLRARRAGNVTAACGMCRRRCSVIVIIVILLIVSLPIATWFVRWRSRLAAREAGWRQAQAEMLAEMDRLRDEAQRARVRAAQVARDTTGWADGYKQGCNDMIRAMAALSRGAVRASAADDQPTDK